MDFKKDYLIGNQAKEIEKKKTEKRWTYVLSVQMKEIAVTLSKVKLKSTSEPSG